MTYERTPYICPGCNKTVLLQKTADGHILAHPLPACETFVKTKADAFFEMLRLATN